MIPSFSLQDRIICVFLIFTTQVLSCVIQFEESVLIKLKKFLNWSFYQHNSRSVFAVNNLSKFDDLVFYTLTILFVHPYGTRKTKVFDILFCTIFSTRREKRNRLSDFWFYAKWQKSLRKNPTMFVDK